MLIVGLTAGASCYPTRRRGAGRRARRSRGSGAASGATGPGHGLHPVSTITQDYIRTVLGWWRAAFESRQAARNSQSCTRGLGGAIRHARPLTSRVMGCRGSYGRRRVAHGDRTVLMARSADGFASASIGHCCGAFEGSRPPSDRPLRVFSGSATRPETGVACSRSRSGRCCVASGTPDRKRPCGVAGRGTDSDGARRAERGRNETSLRRVRGLRCLPSRRVRVQSTSSPRAARTRVEAGAPQEPRRNCGIRAGRPHRHPAFCWPRGPKVGAPGMFPPFPHKASSLSQGQTSCTLTTPRTGP